jgi:hypothetical protein
MTLATVLPTGQLDNCKNPHAEAAEERRERISDFGLRIGFAELGVSAHQPPATPAPTNNRDALSHVRGDNARFSR